MENVDNVEVTISINDKIEHIVEVISSIQDDNIKSILMDSFDQGMNLITNLFDEDGEYIVDSETGLIDTVQIFENFFGVKITDIIADFTEAGYETCGPDQIAGNVEFIKDSDEDVMAFITDDETTEKTDEEVQAEIREKLNFVNSIIDKK